MITLISQRLTVLVVLMALLCMSGFGSIASAQGPGKGKSNAPGLVIAAANQIQQPQEVAEESSEEQSEDGSTVEEQSSDETAQEETQEESTAQEEETSTQKQEIEAPQVAEESEFQFASLAVVQDNGLIYQDNSLKPECEEKSPNEWHWVINGISGTPPANITVHFVNAGDVVVPLEKVTGGVAHYTHWGNLSDSLKAPGATASYDGGYIRFNLSHGPCVQPLDIDKTAKTSYKVEWTWNIVKWADTTDLGELLPGVTDTVNYKVTVEGSSEEIDHMISGKITITNPANNPDAIIESVVDTLSHTGIIDIDCDDAAFPYELEAGEMLECTYSTEVDDMDDTLNTVTVTTSGAVEGGIATANVVWGDPDDVLDECIYVSDTNAEGPQNEKVCADELDLNGEHTFMYAVTFSKDDEEANVLWKCGQGEYKNVASFITNDSKTEGEDDWTVKGTIACFCSLSQGYWFAKPHVGWNPKLELGGYQYSKSDGSSIWKAPNKGGIPTAKKAFTQYAAIMLSAEKYGTIGDIPSEVQDALDVIEAYFDGKPKLTSSNYNKTNIFPNDAAVKEAAGFIGDWIDEHHCAD